MIYPDKPFYVVSGFERAPPEIDMGAYGLATGLDMNLAKKAFGKELTQKTQDRFIEIGNHLVKSIGLTKEDRMIMSPYMFIQNDEKMYTCLLHFVRVPGNACDLGIEWNQIDDVKRENSHRNLLEYGPHNVDSIHQAYGLLSLWLSWADHIYASFQD